MRSSSLLLAAALAALLLVFASAASIQSVVEVDADLEQLNQEVAQMDAEAEADAQMQLWSTTYAVSATNRQFLPMTLVSGAFFLILRVKGTGEALLQFATDKTNKPAKSYEIGFGAVSNTKTVIRSALSTAGGSVVGTSATVASVLEAANVRSFWVSYDALTSVLSVGSGEILTLNKLVSVKIAPLSINGNPATPVYVGLAAAGTATASFTF